MCHQSCSLVWVFYRRVSHNVVAIETSAIGWPPWLIPFWYLWIWRNHVNASCMSKYNFSEINRYQNVINQGGHPIALVSIVTTLCEKSLYKVVHKIDCLWTFNHLILKTSRREDIPMSFWYPVLVCQSWKHGAMWPNARSFGRRSLADTRVIYRRLSPVGYYNQPLAANGNRREGTASK